MNENIAAESTGEARNKTQPLGSPAWRRSSTLASHPHIAFVDAEYYECVCGATCDEAAWDEWHHSHDGCRTNSGTERSDPVRPVRFPVFRKLRDSNPPTGEIWVVDDQNRCWATFRVHRIGTETMDASMNMRLADEFIATLHANWLYAGLMESNKQKTNMNNMNNMNKQENLNFGEAIEALKRGQRVTRPGWNGRGMYLWLLPAAKVKAEWCREPHLKALAEANGGEIEALGSIRMITSDKKVLTGWLASQTDLLAEDWQIIEE